MDTNACICLWSHGDGVPYAKGAHKQVSTEVYSWNVICKKNWKMYLFCNKRNEYLCDGGCHGKHTLDPVIVVFNWPMQTMMGGHFLTKGHDGTPVDKLRAKVSKLRLHFTAALLQSQGWLAVLPCVIWLSNLELSATLLAVQGQPRWEELLSQLFTICTMEEY